MEGITTVVNYFALGLGVWFFTWGINRVYLMFKSLVS